MIDAIYVNWIFILFLNIIIFSCIYIKIRKVHLSVLNLKETNAAHIDNIFNQIQAFIGLMIELKMEKGLPTTRGWAASPDFLYGIGKYV